MQHSDYISGYMAMGEVLKTMSIHPQSFNISKQEFFDQPLTQLTSGGVKYTRAPLAARGSTTCSMVQTCQVNWTIQIPANTLAIQINRVAAAAVADEDTAKAVVNFSADADISAVGKHMTQDVQKYYGKEAEGMGKSEVLRFWLGFSTACGPFNQFAICKDSTKLWDTSIYAREEAVICSNSLSDLFTNNSVSVSPFESIIAGKRHCGWGLRLESIKPHFQFVSCFDEKLCIIIFIALDVGFPARFKSQKPDIVYLQNEDQISYGKFSVRIVNMQDSTPAATAPQNTISQIKNASFTKFEIQNAIFMTFAMPQYPTRFFPVLFHNFDLVIDQRHVVPTPYEALTQAVNGQIGTRAYPDPVEVGLTPITHYLCDAIVQIMFDNNPDPQVLSLEVIVELGGSMVRNG
ncbi:MAG: hypothetical protein EZS28_023624 [Streblomastix strix]|uniref:Uncharacterized protein n=1 Tax=Streblomastix strix TaxID=222440 RepID=A0A5J4VEH5_9EUKA|nr:MAG: hypothetical protein EZS28_023624 [Streblomastix strix]